MTERLAAASLIVLLSAAFGCSGDESSGNQSGRNGRRNDGGAFTGDASQGRDAGRTTATGGAAPSGTGGTGGARDARDGGPGGARAPRDGGAPDVDADAGARDASDADARSPVFTPLCTARSGPVTRISGLRKTRFSGTVAPNAILDATGATWDGTTQDGTPIPWVVTVNGEGPACWYGGSYTGIWDDTDPAVTWENPYHHSGAFTIRVPDFLVEGYRADNQGDGIR